MENKTKISIVIPIYNVAKYLEECVRSAMNQTLKEIEIICVNDGSTDNSLDICKKLSQEDPRVKIVDKPNAGYGNSINVGMANSTGKYFAILESDDYIAPNMFEDLYNCIEKYNVDFVKSNFYYLYNSESPNRLIIKNRVQEDSSFYNKVIDPQKSKYIYNFKTTNWTGIYNLEFLRKNNICHNETPGASYQDTGFCFGVYSKAKSCVFVDEAYYYYRQDNPNASMKSKAKVYAITSEYEFIKKNLEKYNLFEENKGIYTYKKFDAYFYFNYNRIAAEFKKEFLEYMSQDFKKSIDNNEFEEKYFNEDEKLIFLQIANNPTRFYYDNLSWRLYAHQKSLNETKEKLNIVNHSKKYKLVKFISKFIKK